MDGIVIFLIIFIIVLVLVGVGVGLYFAFRKKTPSSGDGGNNNGGGNSNPSVPSGGNEGGDTGPNVVSYLTDSRTYNANDIIQYNSLQGKNDTPMGSLSGGAWTAGVTGTYLVFIDVTNDGGGGNINLLKNKDLLGKQYSISDGTTSLTSLGFANLVPGDKLEIQTMDQLSATNPNPTQFATAHFIMERVTSGSSILYLTNGGSFSPNNVITFSRPQQGTDNIGNINNGIWTPNSPGSYLVFADATNDGGGGSLSIMVSGSHIGTGFKSALSLISNQITVRTMGYITLNTGDTISVTTPSGMNITTPDPSTNATCHFLIQKVLPTSIVSYIFSSSQPNIMARSILNFTELQGGNTDPLGTMNNGVWTSRSSGKFLVFADVTNDGGGGSIIITAANNIIGTGYAESSARGTTTIYSMGYVNLNVGDIISVTAGANINITNPDPLTFATSHLIIYKIV